MMHHWKPGSWVAVFPALLLLSSIAWLPSPSPEPDTDSTRSLAGRWSVRLDRADAGIREAWFEQAFPESLALPGVLQAQGFGDDVTVETPWTGEIVDRSYFTDDVYAPYRQPGNIKVPFWLQPEKYYKGVAWYQRPIEIPASWAGLRVALKLERPHWETRVWLDDRYVGRNDSLSTPHEYTLGVGLEPGPHRLTVRVDNRVVVDIGINSHSITDHTQGNWNGLVGELSLEATPLVWISDLQAFPSLRDHTVRVLGRLTQAGVSAGSGTVRLRVDPPAAAGRNPDSAASAQAQVPVQWSGSEASFEALLRLEPPLVPWDEFHPRLYHLQARLEPFGHEVSTDFGLREIETDGRQLQLNGHKLFLRGTLECAIFPRTGHPPTEVDSWKKLIRTAKAHGLNHIRFHSWCPPKAAFRAADALGFYFQVECGSWANQSTTLGDGKPVDDWIYREAERILHAYGNHPSFLLMLYGNEPGGRHHQEFLARWVEHFRQRDPRRLYSSGSGWPELPENEFQVTPGPRIQAWGQELNSRINALPPETRTDYRPFIDQRSVPVISHEIGQWCVYPNFDEMAKYTGYLKPRNFEIFRESLAAHHMADQARDFLMASGKLQALCYKEDIESALRTPGMGGFQLLDLHDFPGQGTALVGVLDPFWESKGYISADAFRRFAGSTVPLARLEKRVFTRSEQLEVELEIAHFGAAPLAAATPYWKLLTATGQIAAEGRMVPREIPIGNHTSLGHLELPLSDLEVPAKLRLVVGIAGTEAENDWDLWVYPDRVPLAPPQGVVVTRTLDATARRTLAEGGRVIWMLPPDEVAPDPLRGPVGTGFSSIFWNTAWTRGQKPHTLGILCDPQHPALATFPTEFHSNWQWWYLIHHGQAMILDSLPPGLRPIVQMIDDWFTNRRLGLLFEARVGRGRILVTSLDLLEGARKDPVSRQFLACLYAYAGGEAFDPQDEVTLAELETLSR